jgi:hypothetical protein
MRNLSQPRLKGNLETRLEDVCTSIMNPRFGTVLYPGIDIVKHQTDFSMEIYIQGHSDIPFLPSLDVLVV